MQYFHGHGFSDIHTYFVAFIVCGSVNARLDNYPRDDSPMLSTQSQV